MGEIYRKPRSYNNNQESRREFDSIVNKYTIESGSHIYENYRPFYVK
jgi:hypothetical protein